MIAGNGPLDRNENLPSFSLNVFNVLAEDLSQSGIASLRYDKRGCGSSGGDYISAGHSDLVSDAITVANAIQQHRQLAHLPMFLLGHNEGCAIAAQVAAVVEKDKPVTGLIFFCPFTQPMRQVLLQQAEHFQAEIGASRGIGAWFNRSYYRLRGGVKNVQSKFLKSIDASKADTLTIGKATINAKWYREMLALDAAAIMRNIRVPTFALGAGKDLQCIPQDTLHLQELITHAPISTHLEENLTHILRNETNPRATKSRYPALVKQRIEPLVAELSVNFIEETLRAHAPPPHN